MTNTELTITSTTATATTATTVVNARSPEAVKAAGLRPVRLGLFPVMESPEAVIDLGIAQLPITNPNQLVALMMTYHNSLVQAIEKDRPHETPA